MSVQPIEDETVEEIMVQGGAVSPIVTIEPRRRKFHKAITVTMPLPERMSAQYLRRKQENLNTNSLKKDPSKTPIGIFDNISSVSPPKIIIFCTVLGHNLGGKRVEPHLKDIAQKCG